MTIKGMGKVLAEVLAAREVRKLGDQVVMLTNDRGWVFVATGKPLSADQVQAMGRDPGLRDT